MKTPVVSTREISRRRVLAVALGGIAASAAARSARAQSKISKTEASYQDTPHELEKCSLCAYFQPPGGCQLVDGTISPNGWCKLFNAHGSG